MSNIRIEALKGDYENHDVYENVLNYIAKKTYAGGYGFSCIPDYPISEQFRMSKTCSSDSSARKMWHFIITFSASWNHQPLLQLANTVSMGFAPEYQILYGIDTEKGNTHLHFGVNAFSYHPDHPVLSEEIMLDYLTQLQTFLQSRYPHMTVTLQFLGKGE